MLFKRKKPKLDSKVRFQHRQFTQKLEAQRNYKRQARFVPEGKLDIFFDYIGLSTRFRQIVVGIILAGIIYLIYVPNFLTVKSVTVVGLSDSDRSIAEASVRQEIAQSPFYDPQYNMLLMSTDRVRAALQSVPRVYEVKTVRKDYKNHSLQIEVMAKYERFLVRDTERVLDVYNDGSLKGTSPVSKEEWEGLQNPNMIKVRVFAPAESAPYQQFLDPSLVKQIETLASSLQSVPSSPISYIQVGTEKKPTEGESAQPDKLSLPLHSEELRVVLQKGPNAKGTFMVIFDSTASLADAANRLQLLLSQTPADRYNNLYYIDMRLDNRGYVCLINTPCAK